MQTTKKILIVGAGYLGQRVSHFATARGWNVIGARRNPPLVTTTSGVTSWIPIDVTNKEAVRRCVEEATHRNNLDAVIYCVSAGEMTESAYQRAYDIGLGNVLDELPSKTKFIFVSSTGVYHQDSGEFVDEHSPIESNRLPATQSFLVTGESKVLLRPDSIVARFSGIYGPGRTRLISMAQAVPDPYIIERRAFTNRIHVDDGARAVLHLLDYESAEKIYCVTDSEPAMQHDIIVWIRHALNMPQIEICFKHGKEYVLEIGKLPASNKQISNRRLLETGFRFDYPSFREGYHSLLPVVKTE